VFASWVFYALGCVALLRLRRGQPQLQRPYRVWGYPVTPLVFIGFALWLVVSTVIETPAEAAIGALLILAGLPGYWYWSRRPAAVTA
jgi:APA family basic amino acid/polyamine antiporter